MSVCFFHGRSARSYGTDIFSSPIDHFSTNVDSECLRGRREDDNSVQIENGRAGDDDAYNRFQRGVNKVSERELHSVGRGGSG